MVGVWGGGVANAYRQEYIIEEGGEYHTSVPSLRKVLWGQLCSNASESACG